MIVGIVLAAGRSRRMGRPKSFLEIDGRTLLSRSIDALGSGGCDETVVVVGPADDAHASRAAREAAREGARVVVNPDPESEQIDSLRAALSRVMDARAIVVLPVDVPVAGPSSTAAVIREFRRSQAPVVVPVHRGTRGHPVLFSARAFPDLMRGRPSEGARTVIARYAAEVREVEVDEHAAVVDIDTPADYQRAVGGK